MEKRRGKRAPLFCLAVGVFWPLFSGPVYRPCEVIKEGRPSATGIRLTADKVFSLNKEAGFRGVNRIDIDDNGWVYILDKDYAKVFVFDDQGRLVREIGRKGTGEEEFEYPSGLSVAPNGEVAVSDAIKRTVFVFSKEGVFLRKTATDALCIYRISILDNGRFVAMTSPRYGGPFRFELKILDSKLEEIATLGSVLSPQQGNTYDPFWIEMFWVVGENGLIYYSHPADYRIEIFDGEGKRIREIVKDVPQIEITDAEKQEASKGFIPQGYKWIFSKYRAAFQGFSVDEQGRVFVQTWTKDPKTFGYLYDVFDDAGRLIAAFPLNMKPERWKNGKLYTIEGNERGAQVVKRYSVAWE